MNIDVESIKQALTILQTGEILTFILSKFWHIIGRKT